MMDLRIGINAKTFGRESLWNVFVDELIGFPSRKFRPELIWLVVQSFWFTKNGSPSQSASALSAKTTVVIKCLVHAVLFVE